MSFTLQHVYMGASSFSGVSGIGSWQALNDFGRSPKAFSEGALKRFRKEP